MEVCKKCGRKLTNPKYIKLGFGKICYSKHLAEMAEQERGEGNRKNRFEKG